MLGTLLSALSDPPHALSMIAILVQSRVLRIIIDDECLKIGSEVKNGGMVLPEEYKGI